MAARDAVIFVPGLSSGEDEITLDAMARRLAIALDHSAATANATFAVGEASVHAPESVTIDRIDGSNVQPVVDVFLFDYRLPLKARHQGRSPARQAVSILFLLAIVSRRFVRGMFGKAKPAADFVQLGLAGTWLAMIALYFVLLLLTMIATGVELVRIAASNGGTATPVDPDPTLMRIVTQIIPSGALHAAQATIVILTGIGLLRQRDMKQLITDVGIEYASVIDYLSEGPQKNEITGAFRRLLESLAERQHTTGVTYDQVVVVAYSLGSVIAIDSLFHYGKPANDRRFDMITTLVTVGSPFDVIRSFWPHYFDDRHRSSANMTWLNVYSENDVFGSNFKNSDETSPNPTTGVAAVIPTNINYPRRPERLNLLERAMKMRELHMTYWGTSPTAANFLGEIVPIVFAKSPALR